MYSLVARDAVPDPLAPYAAVDRSAPRYETWVIGHMVAGLDGTARVGGRVGALSTPPDQALFRRMRRIGDVVLVGAETVRREGYGPVRLSDGDQDARIRLGKPATPPVAIVSRSLTLDWSTPLFEEGRPYVLTCSAADPGLRAETSRHADVIIAGEESVIPSLALGALAARGHRTVLCEGGPHWLGQLVAADRLDELCLSLSPRMGGDDLPICVTPEGSSLVDFQLQATMIDGDTLFLRYQRP